MELKFQDVSIKVHADNVHGWYMSTADAAKGYGVDRKAITQTIRRNQKEFIDGKHFVKSTRKKVKASSSNLDSGSGGWPQLTLTKRGVIRYGMFANSDRGIAFRDWAEDLLVASNATISPDVFLKKLDEMDKKNQERFNRVEEACGGLRSDLDTVREVLHLYMSETDENTIGDLMKKVKEKTKLDGRTIVGNVRKSLNLASIYDPPHTRQVINALKNMLGIGLIVLKQDDEN
jgi:hypothetical protein